MRELTLLEVNTISGGIPSVNVNCMGPEFFKKAKKRAHSDGVTLGGVVGLLSGIIAYAYTDSFGKAAEVAAVITPYIYIIGSDYSSGWRILYT